MFTTLHTDFEKQQQSLAKIDAYKQQATEFKTTSDKYRLVSTSELMDTCEMVLKAQGLEYSTKISTANKSRTGTRHAVTFTVENSNLQIMGDNLKPTITVINSFQGESSLKVLVGYYRLVCSNGLIVGTSFFSDKVRHVHGQTIEMKLSTLANKVNEALTYIRCQATQQIEQAVSKQLTEEQELQVLVDLKEQKIISARIFERAKDLRTLGFKYNLVRPADASRNVWSLYNCVNEIMRLNSRSELNNIQANVNLMDKFVDATARLVA